jgi:hypothetical protein
MYKNLYLEIEMSGIFSALPSMFGKDETTVGPPDCSEKMESCVDKCKHQHKECEKKSGGRRRKSMKKGGRKSMKKGGRKSMKKGGRKSMKKGGRK